MSYSQALEQQLALLERSKTTKFEFPTFSYPLQGRAAAPYFFPRALELAAPYHWAMPMCEVVEATAPGIPEWALSSDDLVTPYGFCLFGRPLHLPRAKEKDFWQRKNYRIMTGFCWSSDREGGIWLYTLYASQGTATLASGDSLVRLQVVPGLAFGWTFGTPITAPLDYAWPSEYGTPGRVRQELAYVSTCLLLLTQRISVSEEHRVTPLRSGYARPLTIEPVVRAVTLRRLRTEHPGLSMQQQVEWTQRWVVSAHWRQQWYPTLQDHRPVLIQPYVKGPEDKPLKPPRAKVFAVVR